MSSSAGAGDALVTPQIAAARGYDVIVALSHYCYLSRNQGLPDDPYPYYTYTNPLSLQKAYSFDPLSGLNEAEARHVIGSQACVWSESIWSVFDLEWKMWPRALALAEVMWTYPKDRDYAEFRARAAKQRSNLIKKHVNCAPLD
jgi:hexosaminidase